MGVKLDLSLPAYAPELGIWDQYNGDDSSFALYTLIETSREQLQEIASTLEKEWRESAGYEGSHLIRPPPKALNFTGHSLQEAFDAHLELNREDAPLKTTGNSLGELKWYPTAFIVLVNEDWENGGLLFVYADDEHDYIVKRFHFKARDAHSFLSSLMFMDIGFSDAEHYAIDERDSEHRDSA